MRAVEVVNTELRAMLGRHALEVRELHQWPTKTELVVQAHRAFPAIKQGMWVVELKHDTIESYDTDPVVLAANLVEWSDVGIANLSVTHWAPYRPDAAHN